MKVKCCGSKEILKVNIGSELKKYFTKKQIQSLVNLIEDLENVELQIIKLSKVQYYIDAIYIKEISTVFDNSVNEEVDLTYEVEVGNMVPGFINQILRVHDGKLVSKNTRCHKYPLMPRDKTLIYKRKKIIKNKVEEYKSIIYALV